MGNARSEVFTEVNITLLVLRRVVCEECTRHVSQAYVVFIFKQGIFYLVDGASVFLRNVGVLLPRYMLAYLKKNALHAQNFFLSLIFVNIIRRSQIFQEILNRFCEPVSYIGHKLFGIRFMGSILRRVENKKKIILPLCCLCVSFHPFLTC